MSLPFADIGPCSGPSPSTPVHSDSNQSVGECSDIFPGARKPPLDDLVATPYTVVLLNPNSTEQFLHSGPTKVEERNVFARSNPELLGSLVLEAIKDRSRQHGTFVFGNILVNFTPSEIPFHTIFKITCESRPVYHLVSGKHRKLRDPYSYAVELVPLAKAFSRLPNVFQSTFPSAK